VYSLPKETRTGRLPTADSIVAGETVQERTPESWLRFTGGSASDFGEGSDSSRWAKVPPHGAAVVPGAETEAGPTTGLDQSRDPSWLHLGKRWGALPASVPGFPGTAPERSVRPSALIRARVGTTRHCRPTVLCIAKHRLGIPVRSVRARLQISGSPSTPVVLAAQSLVAGEAQDILIPTCQWLHGRPLR